MSRQGRLLAASLLALSILVLVPTSMAQPAPDPKVLEAAKKEAEVIWYTTLTLDMSKEVMDRFNKKYPFIKPTLYRTAGGPLLNRILSEARTGGRTWDVAVGPGLMVVPLMERKLLATYRSPEAAMIYDDLVDKDGYWASFYTLSFVLGYNTKLIRKEDLPKTYEDLLQPKWKGSQISLDVEAYEMLQGLIAVWGRSKAISYFKSLAAQQPRVQRGSTHRATLAAAGEFPLVVAFNQTCQRMIMRGAPIDWIPLEPAVVRVNPTVLAANAPHPNAAKLFIDFVLSKEGQQMMQAFGGVPVRKDVEPEPPRLFRGYKWVIAHPRDYKNYEEIVKLYNEIFSIQ
jgi:iron(III) transport system substrate-binding protein